MNFQIDLIKPELVRENHLQLIKRIIREKNTPIFYIDDVHDLNSKISTAAVMLYHNSKMASRAWNLGIGMNIADAELYAIKKSIE